MSLKLLVPTRLRFRNDSLAVPEIVTFAHLSSPKDHVDRMVSIGLLKTVSPMSRRSTMGRGRKGKAHGRESGDIIRWDVNRADRSSGDRRRRCVYGDSTRRD